MNKNGKIYKFTFKTISKGTNKAEFHTDNIILKEKVIEIKKDNISYSFKIYCYNILITILKYYNFVYPIFYIKNKNKYGNK